MNKKLIENGRIVIMIGAGVAIGIITLPRTPYSVMLVWIAFVIIVIGWVMTLKGGINEKKHR